MPLIKPQDGQSKDEFIKICMSNSDMMKEFPDEKQRFAICNSQWEAKNTLLDADGILEAYHPLSPPTVNVNVDTEPLLDLVKNEVNKIKEESFSINVKPEEDDLIERRSLDLDEFRFDAEKNELSGYAARFGVWSEDLGGFKERIKSGAFSQTINNGDVRFLFNHDPNFILARTPNGTMSLEEDRKGLGFVAKLPDTTYAKDLKESIRRGDISQMSFGFRVINDKWKISDDINKLDERTLTEVKLFDISAVTYPAYPQTTVKVRSILKLIGIDWEIITEIYRKLEKGIITKDERFYVKEQLTRLLEEFVEPETKEPIIENHSEEVVEPRSNLTRIREREMELFVKYL